MQVCLGVCADYVSAVCAHGLQCVKECVCERAQVYLSQECESRCVGSAVAHGELQVYLWDVLVVCTLTDAWPHPSLTTGVTGEQAAGFQGSPPQPRAITLSRLGARSLTPVGLLLQQVEVEPQRPARLWGSSLVTIHGVLTISGPTRVQSGRSPSRASHQAEGKTGKFAVHLTAPVHALCPGDPR